MPPAHEKMNGLRVAYRPGSDVSKPINTGNASFVPRFIHKGNNSSAVKQRSPGGKAADEIFY
jgi:hypothetical protein